MVTYSDMSFFKVLQKYWLAALLVDSAWPGWSISWYEDIIIGLSCSGTTGRGFPLEISQNIGVPSIDTVSKARDVE